MDILEKVRNLLLETGRQLKGDLWRAEDEAFLKARARDLVGLARKAAEAQETAKRAAYVAAARDTLESVKLLALIRMETGAQHVLDALGRFFMSHVIPRLTALLPALLLA